MNIPIAATKLKNALLNNHFADLVIEYSSRTKNFAKPNSIIRKYHTQHYIMEQGCNFEKNIIKQLYEKFPEDIISLNSNPFSQEDIAKTKETIQNKVPIILNAVLYNDENHTFGLPDIIIRQDFLKKIFVNFPESISTSDTHYAIIDIKFCTLPLTVNFAQIKNTNFFPAYKGQLNIYREALNKITNSQFAYGFILSRGVKTCKIKISDPFLYPGIIHYDSFDKDAIEKNKNALDWLRCIKTMDDTILANIIHHGILPYYDVHFYPNLKVLTDPPWILQHKHNVAAKIGEITQLWMCGQKIKMQAHNLGIYSWHDAKFANLLTNSSRDQLIKKIININLDDTKLIELPDDNNFLQFPAKLAFLDFEVLSDIIADNSFACQNIFMIGVGFIDAENKFTYAQFTSKILDESEEVRVCAEFIEYIKNNNLQEHEFTHWSRAENWQWQKARSRLSHDYNIKLFDLCEYIKKHQIVVNSCFDFSLKNFAKAMHKHKLIETSWEESGPVNGLDTIIKLHNTIENRVFCEKTMEKIKYYNYVDIKVLHEILARVVARCDQGSALDPLCD